MFFYLVIFGIVSLAALTSVAFNERKEIVVAKSVLLCAMFWVLSFARWRNGTDWGTYIYTYRSLALHGTLHDAFSGYMAMEPGYLLLNLALGFVGSYHVFLMCVGAVVVGLKLYRIIDLSNCAAISCLVYLCTMFGDIFFVRQAIAISICFFAYKYLIDNKPKKFIFLVLVASTFHYSAIVALVGLFSTRDKPRSVARDATLILLAAVGSKILIGFLSRFIAAEFSLIPYLSARARYITDNSDVSALSSTARDVARIANIALVYLFFSLRSKYITLSSKRIYAVMLNLFFVGTLIVCCFSLVSVQMVRFAMYFTTAEIILLPMAIYTYRGAKRFVALLVFVGYLFLQYIIFMQPYYNAYVPYHLWGVAI